MQKLQPRVTCHRGSLTPQLAIFRTIPRSRPNRLERCVIGLRLALPAGKVLSCFTTHTLETYTPAWVGAGIICLIATVVVLPIGRRAAQRAVIGIS